MAVGPFKIEWYKFALIGKLIFENSWGLFYDYLIFKDYSYFCSDDGKKR